MENDISNRTGTHQTLKQNDFRIKKSLGQNFLVDSNILDKIVNSAQIDKNTGVIEIGPGLGALTQRLAEKAGKVVGIEIDKELIPILNKNLSGYSNIEIINNDVLDIDISEIISNKLSEFSSIKIVGNLPYYITSPIIIKLLTENSNVDTITILIQKEVAERINAKPGGKEYGSLTILINYYAEVSLAFHVSSNVFIPKPKVDSAVLQFKIRKLPPVQLENQEFLFKVVRSCFKNRRKTLYNNLINNLLVKEEKDQLTEILTKSNIDGIRRAETLSIEEFANLANNIYLYIKNESTFSNLEVLKKD
ncbi:MAG: 16S rRNA (adenine(1518)-N(6)/adenine(1519)-N(6))-dimethyltransferase RsmA [Vulcanibacillus sp.]